MDQRGGRLGLALEPLQVDMVVGQLRLEDLDSHTAFEPDLLGQIDLGHGPAAQPSEELEITQVAAGQVYRTRYVGGFGNSVAHQWQKTAGAEKATLSSMVRATPDGNGIRVQGSGGRVQDTEDARLMPHALLPTDNWEVVNLSILHCHNM